jgi:signal transduction histidine kinase
VQGRWSLDRDWYWAYSEQVRRILDRQAGHDAEIDALAAGEAEKRSLTRAVEAIVEEGAVAGASSTRALSIDGRLFVALTASSADQMRGVVLSTSALSEYVWPVVFSAVLDEAALTLTDVSRTPLFTSGAGELSPTSDPRFATARLVHDAGFTWRIDVRLRHPDALLASFYRRQWLYMAMLAVTVASLVVGTMMTLRTVSRELAVARLKSQFVSAVSHEFRTPLTGIRHYGEMLLHDRVSTEDRKHHYYAQVVAAAERLSRLVEDVLDFARMEEGRQEYRLEPIETTAWLRQAAAEFQAALERDKRLEATIADDLPIVRGDRSALARAIHNLLDNAVKYSPGCDTIWLDAQAVESDLVVAVRDKGIGIPSDEQAHIFERFFRGHGVAASARGTGLGLSIVQHIVSAHGGTIDIESEPGQGTTVTMRLPRERPECAS